MIDGLVGVSASVITPRNLGIVSVLAILVYWTQNPSEFEDAMWKIRPASKSIFAGAAGGLLVHSLKGSPNSWIITLSGVFLIMMTACMYWILDKGLDHAWGPRDSNQRNDSGSGGQAKQPRIRRYNGKKQGGFEGRIRK